jgi:ADP-ribose pyrophosphatase YjhB (NUDIX family)
MDGMYGLPGGKVEKNEGYIAGAIREAKEETGVDLEPSQLKHIMTVYRKGGGMYWLGVWFEVRECDGK